ncbi:MAG: hypothetical protein LBV09_08085 [Deferribacteraceae bacterium]|nr:hypothetical protein [Deferribacteraceae bacterium]
MSSALKRELQSMIDILPEQSLLAVKPILTLLSDDYWRAVVEVADEDEIVINERCLNDSSQEFISLADFKKELSL